ncbi:MAG TPA: hypothetical protein VKF41_11235 [Bryobacteraceae bacterium]|nr:hypothetical protein [Bryobacteraceae bacterium]
MEYPETGGEFDAHRLMQIHLQLQPQPPGKAYRSAMGALVVLIFAPLLLAIFLPTPPIWLVAIEAGMPLIALVAALCLPKWCKVFGDRAGGLFFGIWFFAGMGLLGGLGHASLVRDLPALEMGLAAGAVLFAAAVIVHRRLQGNSGLLAILFVFSLAWGYGAVFQANCLLDHSSSTVYRTVASGKHTGRGGKTFLDLEPWGANPTPKSPGNRYSASVPSEIYDAVRVGSPVCVEQREGALGMAWYTARPCR